MSENANAQPRLRPQRIVRVKAWPMNIPVKIEVVGVSRTMPLSACLCEVETADGFKGHGFTAITEEDVVSEAINKVIAPTVVGCDAMATEAIWEELNWVLTPRGQSGYASHAIAAFDIALWDIKAKALGMPLWRLIGGARAEVPIYTTFGFGFLSRDELVSAAKYWVAKGNKRLKMTVAGEAMRHRNRRPLGEVIREDAARVMAVREAVGNDVEIYIDANCNLDAVHACKLAKMLESANLGFFEEPVLQNDARHLAELRQRTSVRIAVGQNEGQAFRFRDLLMQQAVDFIQPNVAITGGFSQCIKIAGMAAAFNTSIANGGAWPFHNMHLHAGLANGGLVEYHHPAVQLCEQIFTGLPVPENGVLALPEAPGLGFSPILEAVEEFSRYPSARGKGKG
ncbi:mandelate racemase/muconate lactonizing enzyme family protein [Halomonas sp. MCCC 1A11036]|uniref:Mandelate racemase/muconate lactonizing enzyme family protein n=1 Tax=Billgrantia zhangzhouensis TaxID=2733481 RepID=A0ABS9AK19_9GAMM|nr:mandelate racemase/muconate lactonizing enzyme family protein [Halomonas zhangzhouensis]MCE8022084.1 mandelate racemase/muconate lactonizing enzyme family protein [Halomonas zhangzhouensis]